MAADTQHDTSVVDRFLGLFADVRASESGRCCSP